MKPIVVLIATASFSGIAFAQSGPAHDAQQLAEVKVAQASTAPSEGEVRKIDKETQKMTIKHGPIPNLEMPGMTMVFRVKDAAMLDQVKAGDKIKFTADKVNGAYTVTTLEAAK